MFWLMEEGMHKKPYFPAGEQGWSHAACLLWSTQTGVYNLLPSLMIRHASSSYARSFLKDDDHLLGVQWISHDC